VPNFHLPLDPHPKIHNMIARLHLRLACIVVVASFECVQ
jgi:hypothetical protein